MGDDKIVKAEAGFSSTTGEGRASLELGGAFMGFWARLRPSATLRAGGRLVMGGQLLDKWRRGEALTQEEAEYLEAVLAPEEAKLVRKTAIMERAKELLLAEGAKGPATGEAAPSEDWTSRILEDMGLVSDEMLKELYARVLVSEIQKPGTSSLRTLAALRSMDRGTAELFAKVIPFIVSDFIPEHTALLQARGVTIRELMVLEEAGLVHAEEKLKRIEPPGAVFSMKGYLIVAEFVRRETFPAYWVRTAGQELARVSDIRTQPADCVATAEWLSREVDGRVGWAARPEDWDGKTNSIDWSMVDKLAKVSVPAPPAPASRRPR